jgi:hypothetical protein
LIFVPIKSACENATAWVPVFVNCTETVPSSYGKNTGGSRVTELTYTCASASCADNVVVLPEDDVLLLLLVDVVAALAIPVTKIMMQSAAMIL